MNNLEGYERAVGIRRRNGIIVGDTTTDFFAGVELDARTVEKVDDRDWSLENLIDDDDPETKYIPNEFRDASQELLERMPDPETPREIKIANAVLDIGWIEAMSKRSEWGKLHLLIDVQKKSADKRLTKSGVPKPVRDERLRLRYLELREDLDDLPARQKLHDEFDIGLSHLTGLLRKMRVLPNTKT